MPLLDLIFLALLFILGVRALIRGFIKEILSLAAPLGGLLAGVFFSKAGAPLAFYLTASKDQLLNQVISFLIIFLLVYFLVFLLQRLLHTTIESLKLEKLDKALGFVIGLLEGLAFIFILLIALSLVPLAEIQRLLQESFTYNFFKPLLPELFKGE